MQTIIENERGLETRNDELRKSLTAIAVRPSGLTPTTLLNVAKNPKSELHKYFCWDDTEAARKYREMQAYELIRRVKVVIETEDKKPITVRAFFPVKQIENDGTIDYSKRGKYFPVSSLSDDGIRQTIENAKSDLRAFEIKYSNLSCVLGFDDLFRAISKIR
jgi:hypothetical protein